MAALPAFIYAFQNLLIMNATMYLDGLTLNLINQSKTLFTAVAVYLLLGRRQSRLQCVALVLLFSASVLLALEKSGGHTTKSDPADAWFFLGIVQVVSASILSGVASALSQRSLQVRQERDVKVGCRS